MDAERYYIRIIINKKQSGLLGENGKDFVIQGFILGNVVCVQNEYIIQK